MIKTDFSGGPGFVIAEKILSEEVLSSKFCAFDAWGLECRGTFWIFFRMGCCCGR
jgi:hypothetical protein